MLCEEMARNKVSGTEISGSEGYCPCFQYKLCKVKSLRVGSKGVPHLTTHDGRTIRYPDPSVKVNDTVKVDIASGKIDSFIKFDSGETLSINSMFEVWFDHLSTAEVLLLEKALRLFTFMYFMGFGIS